ncbi:hypothetical protein [Phocaeicola sp.]
MNFRRLYLCLKGGIADDAGCVANGAGHTNGYAGCMTDVAEYNPSRITI